MAVAQVHQREIVEVPFTFPDGQILPHPALVLSCDDSRTLSDIVVEDLFAGAFEPIHSPLDPTQFAWCAKGGPDWVLRSDARDDRMLLFPAFFNSQGCSRAHYAVRAVSPGDFTLPSVTASGMYDPTVRAVGPAPRTVRVVAP